ncbi:protein TolR [Limihaloglobus sulfuriphilus]|uniref:Protein TolR n=1 Tax=Limihaloglobus sulfuriphilus TaxID=1851148 RepID=A0A1Q2MD02_9BACT|nr:biopolymer transporter ExbD [Limihaloglobus sulfuriphilus]AQQ70571.1 protein TolR [Limihaloglobus sulfuriphilus]
MKDGKKQERGAKSGHISKSVLSRLIQSRRRSYSLRMMPMIDVIFLLLIFFLVTAKFRPKEDFLPVALPSDSQSSELNLIEPLLIELSSNDNGLAVVIGGYGELTVPDDEPETGLVDFERMLLEVFEAQSRTVGDPVELDCSDNLKWQHLALVYNMLYGLGINDITFPLSE